MGEYSADALLLQAGVFKANIEDFPSDDWSVDGRIVYAPMLGDTQFHLGSSVHYCELNPNNPGDETVRYRQRPLVHFTDTRFINTDRIAAHSEFGLGLESAMIAGPLHVSAEGFRQAVGRGDAVTACDPAFFGGFVEAGYFLTKGDSRGYKNGKFDRVKPKRPIGANGGGGGAVQVNARYDYLDLNDAGIIGGKQNSYHLSIIWTTTDRTRLMLNYARLDYDDAVFARTDGSTSYGVDAVGMRAQMDF